MRLGINLNILLLIVSSVLITTSCDEGQPSSFDFDRSALLNRYWDEVIIPAFEDFRTAQEQVEQSWMDFSLNPNSTNLELLQTQLLIGWKNWQYLAPLEIGPLSDFTAVTRINTHPADSSEIENLIAAGSWDLSTADHVDVNGFPALDYLFNANGSLDKYNAVGSENRIAFTADVLEFMSLESLESDMDSYRSNWLAADGTDAGSSLAIMINTFNAYLERNLRDGKVGIPLGKRTLGILQPASSEALFDGNSLPLLMDAVLAYRTIYEGPSGNSLKDYLQAAENFQESEADITQLISEQIDETLNRIADLTLPVSEAVNFENEELESVYASLQQLIVLLKVDMPSLLGVLITYQDNDGD